MSAPASVIDLYISPNTSVSVSNAGTVRVVSDHFELNLRFPVAMSNADKAAKCMALSAVLSELGLRFADLDALVPSQREGGVS